MDNDLDNPFDNSEQEGSSHGMQKTNFICVLNCLIHNGDPSYLNPKSKKHNCLARFFWTFVIFLCVLGAIVLSILSCLSCDHSTCGQTVSEAYNGLAGLTIIGILTAAAFMTFTLFISGSLFNKGFYKERNDVVSLATLILLYQIALTFVCFLDVIFPFDDVFEFSIPWIRYSIQSFTVIFMMISDIHLIMHIAPIVLSKE